jgi:hypothetical protein
MFVAVSNGVPNLLLSTRFMVLTISRFVCGGAIPARSKGVISEAPLACPINILPI